MVDEERNLLRKRTVKRQKIIIALVALLIVASAVVLAAVLNRWEVRIKLQGGDTITAQAGEAFQDPGVSAEYYGNILRFKRGKLDVKTSGTVDVSRPGKYELSYTASYKGKQKTAVRTVEVKDTEAPVIHLETKADSYTLPNHPYEEEGYTATDNLDGDVTANVVRTEKDGTVYYTVKDAAGNEGKAERKIVYDDRTAPVLTLNGGDNLSVVQNTQFHDSYTAIDDADGDVTGNVSVEGSVDTSKVGVYKLVYKVKDAHGNEAVKERTVTVKSPEAQGQKIVYLTFDDGPGKLTERLLGILQKYNVKATFFVTHVFPAYENMLKAESDAGHTVAVHTYTHDYAKVYASSAAYWADFDQMNQIVEKQTGKKATFFRFPGGSSNTVSRKYSPGIMTQLSQEAAQKGYLYFDWNVSSGDAGETRDSNQVAQNIINGISKRNVSVVLCHDTHEWTINAMDQVLSWATQNGYTFLPIAADAPQAHQKINN